MLQEKSLNTPICILLFCDYDLEQALLPALLVLLVIEIAVLILKN